MGNRKLMRFILGASIIGVSAFMFAFAVVQSAQAQTTWQAMDYGDGWKRYSSIDGTVGYSKPMGQGWRRWSFSDGTTVQEQDWNDWSQPQYDQQPADTTDNYGWELDY